MNQTSQHDPLIDPTIGAAYDRLGEGLHAPADGPARVQRRIAVRRRRRRATVAVGALAVVGGVGLAAVTTGGEPDRAIDAATQPEPRLSTTRPDGTTYTFEDVEMTCQDGLITAQSPQRIVGTGDDAHLEEPFLYIEARTKALTPGETLTLPVDGPGGSDTYPLLLFFAMDGDRDANELSSAVTGSSGTVVVREATCGPEPRLALDVDAVLGSEVEQPSMPLTGELR